MRSSLGQARKSCRKNGYRKAYHEHQVIKKFEKDGAIKKMKMALTGQHDKEITERLRDLYKKPVMISV